jgi:hypothetical protein
MVGSKRRRRAAGAERSLCGATDRVSGTGARRHVRDATSVRPRWSTGQMRSYAELNFRLRRT